MEANYTGDQAKIYQVFKSFDKNGDGSIDASEIIQASSELGHPIDNSKAEEIIKQLDLNGDGGLSFDEFYGWYLHGRDGNPMFDKLVQGKAEAFKSAKKIGEKLDKLGLSSKLTGGVGRSTHTVSVRVGDKPPQSSLNIKLVAGSDQQELMDPIFQYFTVVDPTSPSIIFKGRSSDPETGKAKFMELFEQIIAMAEGMLPPDISSVLVPSIQYEVVVPEPNYLAFIITSDFPFLIDAISNYTKIYDNLIPADLGFTVELEGSAPYNSKDLLNAKDKQFLDVLMSSGISLQLTLSIHEAVANLLRSLVFEQMEKKLESNPGSHSLKQMKMNLPLFLLENSRIAFNFKTLDDLSAQFGIPGQALTDISNQIATQGNPGAFISEIPVAADLINAFQNSFEREYFFALSGPKVSVVYTANSEEDSGSAEFFNFLVGI